MNISLQRVKYIGVLWGKLPRGMVGEYGCITTLSSEGGR